MKATSGDIFWNQHFEAGTAGRSHSNLFSEYSGRNVYTLWGWPNKMERKSSPEEGVVFFARKSLKTALSFVSEFRFRVSFVREFSLL